MWVFEVALVVWEPEEGKGRYLTARLTRRLLEASRDSASEVSVASGSLQMMRKVRAFAMGRSEAVRYVSPLLRVLIEGKSWYGDGSRVIKGAPLMERVEKFCNSESWLL